MIAQLFLIALFVFAVAKTFWPKRSVALPTVGPAQSAELQQLREENELLKRRLDALESRVDSPLSS
jgi:hypothetical protein